ncbi:MAG: hypothetical protein K2U26_02095 [Cyclobacteriaceae bacterium]|nr:hypothetical protein [Cyclobacteriaceae bacterium]
MKKISGVIYLCFMSILAIGQTEQADSVKNHIGFNTAFLFSNIFQTSPNASPFTIMYKRQVKGSQAIRFGAGMLLSTRNSKQSNSSTISENFSNFQLSIGKEFQKILDKHWMWYWGGDVTGTYAKSTSDSPVQESTTYGAILRPFLGVRFDINPRLYLSTEAYLDLTYVTTTRTQTNSGATTDSSSDGFSFGTAPAAGIFFFYRF